MINQKLIYQIIVSFYGYILVLLALLFGFISFTQFIIGYLLYCVYVQLVTKTELYYTKNSLNEKILSLCPSIANPNFKPHFLLPLCYQQMISIALWKVPNANKIKFTKEQVNSEGVNLFYAKYEDAKPFSRDHPILFVMPGMTGNIEDPYVINMAKQGLNNGFHVIIYQMRIIADECKLPECGTFTLYGDIDLALDAIRKKYTGKIYAVGGSYGANNLVYYLGHMNSKNKKIEAAVSISNPYDMLLCERLCEDTIFEWLVTYLEKDNLKKIRKSLEQCKNNFIDTEFLMNNENMKAYDEGLTRKVLGYKSADEYYRDISAYQKMKDVNIPLLCISSKDDGLTSGLAIPYDDIRMNENIMLLATERGSHMCFISNEKLFEFRQWVTKPVFEFLKAFRDNDLIH